MPEKLIKIFCHKYDLSSETERHNSEPEFSRALLNSGENLDEIGKG